MNNYNNELKFDSLQKLLDSNYAGVLEKSLEKSFDFRCLAEKLEKSIVLINLIYQSSKSKPKSYQLDALLTKYSSLLSALYSMYDCFTNLGFKLIPIYHISILVDKGSEKKSESKPPSEILLNKLAGRISVSLKQVQETISQTNQTNRDFFIYSSDKASKGLNTLVQSFKDILPHWNNFLRELNDSSLPEKSYDFLKQKDREDLKQFLEFYTKKNYAPQPPSRSQFKEGEEEDYKLVDDKIKLRELQSILKQKNYLLDICFEKMKNLALSEIEKSFSDLLDKLVKQVLNEIEIFLIEFHKGIVFFKKNQSNTLKSGLTWIGLIKLFNSIQLNLKNSHNSIKSIDLTQSIEKCSTFLNEK